MKVEVRCELRSVNKGREFKRRDGSMDNNYTVLVEADGYSETFPTVKEVYDLFDKGFINRGDEVTLLADYCPRYKFNQFVVVGAER